MRRLAGLFLWALPFAAAAQSFPVHQANLEYFVTGMYGHDFSKIDLHTLVKDHSGLYWFQSKTDILSFDGVYTRKYAIRSARGEDISIRVNDIRVSDDGHVWLATEDGLHRLNREKGLFVHVKELYPEIKNFPLSVSCIKRGKNALILSSVWSQGFYYFDYQSRVLKHIILDGESKSELPTLGSPVAVDTQGNLWGLTLDNKGIWHYNIKNGNLLRSWKGELPFFTGNRFTEYILGLTYDRLENTLWISYGNSGKLERMDMASGKSSFYSFTEELKIRTDTVLKKRFPVGYVKIDRDENKWVRVNNKYLVRLDPDLRHCEYLEHHPFILPIKEWRLFEPDEQWGSELKKDDILHWVVNPDGICIVKKRSRVVRQVPFDTTQAQGLQWTDLNNPENRKTIFFIKGKGNRLLLLQQNPGRPKFICFNDSLKVEKVLFNDQWKKFPAYFNADFNPDTLFLAIMRPGIEPIDFRNVILMDLQVDLRSFQVEERLVGFEERIRRYGAADDKKTHWLYSNGFLYSYDPSTRVLDSIFICKPSSKGSFTAELTKGYDYPTVLHKPSSSFWINFPSNKEIYKIDLRSRKIVRIIKGCLDNVDCDLPGTVAEMYPVGSDKIGLQLSVSMFLLDPASGSLTNFDDLFKTTLPAEGPNGIGRYKEWLYEVNSGNIYFVHSKTGEGKQLTLRKDFKWIISQFNSAPLVNNRGEMILMSTQQKGFLVFHIDSIPALPRPGVVGLSFIKINNRHLPVDSILTKKVLQLKRKSFNNIQIGFSDYNISEQERVIYEYALYKGGDTAWVSIEGRPELSFPDISPGSHRLLLRASNGFGGYSPSITSLDLNIIPPFTQTAWFRLLLFVAALSLVYAAYRYRLKQLVRLQSIRNNIARDLHDDIGSTLNSISIYSEVARQQAGRDIPALGLIGAHSRKVIENMSDIVWTINPENDSFEKIISRMRSFAYQLLKARNVEFTFEADEKLNSIALPMQVRKNFYLVFKEAITNVVKYSEATMVRIFLFERDKTIVLKIHDNGKGIPVNPETQGNGLLNMHRRAKEIQGQLLINSANGDGTTIELQLQT